MIILISGIAKLLKFKEQWRELRITEVIIKCEKILFETSTSPYNTDKRFNLYVENL